MYVFEREYWKRVQGIRITTSNLLHVFNVELHTHYIYSFILIRLHEFGCTIIGCVIVFVCSLFSMEQKNRITVKLLFDNIIEHVHTSEQTEEKKCKNTKYRPIDQNTQQVTRPTIPMVCGSVRMSIEYGLFMLCIYAGICNVCAVKTTGDFVRPIA